MKKYILPTANGDLKVYAARKNAKYAVCFLLYVVFFAAAFMFYNFNRYEDAEPLKWWVYPVYFALILISGWYVCLMNRFAFDRSFSGKITSMGLFRSFDRGLSRKAGASLDDHTYIKVVVTDERGKKRKTRIQLFDDGYDGYYREGCEMVKFRGLNYPLCLESENDGAHLCAVCGVRTNYIEGKTVHGTLKPEIKDGVMICRSCGHTLIGTALKEEN